MWRIKFRHRSIIAVITLITMCFYLGILMQVHDEETFTLKNRFQMESKENEISMDLNFGLKYEIQNNSGISNKTAQQGNKTTMRTTAVVNPDRFHYLLNEPNTCNSDTDLIILLITAPDHFIRRLVIRNTWGSVKTIDNFNMKLVFLLGTSHRARINYAIKQESRAHRDIIQESFKDSYRNLTLKTIMGLKWVTKHCPKAKFILKCDDDIFVNVYNLVKYLERFKLEGKHDEMFLMCRLNDGLVDRNNQSKWFVTENEFFGKKYPPYCDGPAYLFSKKAAINFYNMSFYTPLFWLEDVYTTGIIAGKLKVNHTAFNSKYHHAEIQDKEMTNLKLSITKLYLFVNVPFPEQAIELWNIIREYFDDRKKRIDHHIPIYLEDSERLKKNKELWGKRGSK